MADVVIVGRGAVASAAARRLAESGDRVRMVSRSGGGPEGVERIALDAGDTEALADAVKGADTVVNAVATPYHTWPELMPVLFDSVLTAAERTGADLVMLGNLYGYARTAGPLTERTPLDPPTRKGRVRADLWLHAKAAHDAGRLRVTELRAGQFVGPGAYSAFGFLVEPHVMRGELALVHGNPDAQHAFTYTEDAAAALIALARSETAWGRAWIAPILTATVREVAARLAELRGASEPRLEQLTEREMTLLGFTDPMWNEFREMSYMSDQPFLVDDGDLREAFGVKASPLDVVVA
ncbi:NAD-dependent epimerase/dehydratase family protein [Glycomyces dulcitolivorans]|uniref:NAD-dependent epimerase/dehydratase family protein n=1 Tax=Glycomyces dulcitolivorans TaxID=2200759 RepID=UPI0018E4FBE3|nr:NAD-dependent epimerase/dehydratase family protein [Glycomyces dulcitolivorans]